VRGTAFIRKFQLLGRGNIQNNKKRAVLIRGGAGPGRENLIFYGVVRRHRTAKTTESSKAGRPGIQRKNGKCLPGKLGREKKNNGEENPERKNWTGQEPLLQRGTKMKMKNVGGQPALLRTAASRRPEGTCEKELAQAIQRVLSQGDTTLAAASRRRAGSVKFPANFQKSQAEN